MKQVAFEISELALRAFVRTSGLFRNRTDPFFSQFGISSAQWGVLRQLHRAEKEGFKELRLADLGLRLLVKPPSVTSLVDRVVRMGLVTRTASKVDQRAKRVALTPSGRKLVVRVLKQRPAQIRSILAGLNEQEQRELHFLMEKLGKHLESLGSAHVEGPRNSLPPVPEFKR